MANSSSPCIALGGAFNVKETTPWGDYLREGEEPLDPRMLMGGNVDSSRWVGVLLVFLFTLPLLSTVQAQGGGVLIDVSSFGAEDYASTESENLTVSMELHELAGASANVSLTLRVETLEGVVLSNQSQVLPELTPFEQRNISATFVGLPYGYSRLTAEISGDVGTNTSTHLTSVARTVQRLRPLAVTLGGIGSVVAEGVDESGLETTNLSLHDGDHLSVEFPIINQGDINWSGGAVLTIENAGQTEANALTNLTVQASSSYMVLIQPSLRLSEGDLSWWVNLTGDLGEETGTHALSGTWSVGPPPLPILIGQLTSNSEAVQAGQTLDVTLEVWNNGTAPFSGSFVCFEDDVEVLNTTASTLPAGTSGNWSFQRSAKPMLIECEAAGTRLDSGANFPVHLSVDMPSAVFESAGSPTPSLNGGPWHQGDTVSANMLLRNTGSLDGRIRLVLSTGPAESAGSWLELKQGAAGEITANLQLLSSGQQSIAWTLESDDGLVSGAQTGVTELAIKEQQSVAVSIFGVNTTNEQGVEFTVNLDLDEGKARNVRLQVGYETGDSTVFLQENDLLLQQGLHQYTYTFGAIDGDRIVAQLTPVDWLIGPGRLDASVSMPGERTQFWIELDVTTNPLRPVAGDAVDLRLTLRQSGPFQSTTGDLWVLDAQRTTLAQVQSPTWNGASSVDQTVQITWPKGSNVELEALWLIDGATTSAIYTYTSGEVQIETDDGLPLAAIVWGLVAGVGISLVLRLQARKGAGESSTEKKPASKPKVADTQSDEKREIACPQCDRRLRVPVSYSGSVGCPDCGHKFPVEPEPPLSVVEDEEVEEIVRSETDESPPTKVEVGCPACSQTLRIPSTYKGSVRCPACTNVFKSHEGLRKNG